VRRARYVYKTTTRKKEERASSSSVSSDEDEEEENERERERERSKEARSLVSSPFSALHENISSQSQKKKADLKKKK